MMDGDDLNLSESCFLRVFLRENSQASTFRYALASADDHRVIDGLVPPRGAMVSKTGALCCKLRVVGECTKFEGVTKCH